MDQPKKSKEKTIQAYYKLKLSQNSSASIDKKLLDIVKTTFQINTDNKKRLLTKLVKFATNLLFLPCTSMINTSLKITEKKHIFQITGH